MAIRGAGRPSDAITARWVEKNPLGAALRLARSHRGLTQREMSEALRNLPVDLGGGEVLRASQATISKYEGVGGRQTVHKLLRGYSLVLGYHPTALKSLAGLLVVELESLREEQRSVPGEHWEAFAERVLGRIDTWHALSLEGNPQALTVVGPAGGLGPLAQAPEDETDAGSIGPTFDVIARPRPLGHLAGPSGKHALARRPAAGWLAGLPLVLRTPLRRGAVVALVLAVASIGVVAIPPLLTGKAAHLTHGKASPTVGPSVSPEASSSGAGGVPGGPSPTASPQSGSNTGLGSDNHTATNASTTGSPTTGNPTPFPTPSGDRPPTPHPTPSGGRPPSPGLNPTPQPNPTTPGPGPSPLQSQGKTSNGLIAYAAKPFGTNIYNIFAMDSDGNHKQQLTSFSDADAVYPSWSPDGSRIAFAHNGSVLVMNADGSSMVTLTSGGATTPAWSPDGTKIAFSRAGIEVMNADGGNVMSLTTTGLEITDDRPQWSPDGKSIVYETFDAGGGHALGFVHADGSPYLSPPQCPTQCAGESWSPDGTKICFTEDPTTKPNQGILTMNLDGSGVTTIVPPGESGIASAGLCAWSPDGARVLFQAYEPGTGSTNLYVVGAGGGNIFELSGGGVTGAWQRLS